MQALPGLIFSKTARANSSDFPLSGALRQMPERNAKDDTLASAKSLDEDLDSVVVLKVVILSITLWQRTLTSPHAQVPGHSGQLAHERVEALARYVTIKKLLLNIFLRLFSLQCVRMLEGTRPVRERRAE